MKSKYKNNCLKLFVLLSFLLFFYIFFNPNSSFISEDKSVLSSPRTAANGFYVISPIDTSSWRAGRSYAIQWTSDDYEGNVYISLYLGSKRVVFIATTEDDGYYDWMITTDLDNSNYRILIQEYPYDELDYSDYFQIISAKKITISTPDSLATGRDIEINWSTGHIAPYERVKIDLYKGSQYQYTINNNTINSKSFEWYLPLYSTPGDDYRYRITYLEDTSISVYSEEFEIVTSSQANLASLLSMIGIVAIIIGIIYGVMSHLFAQRSKESKEKKEYGKIPNLIGLIRSFLYYQLKRAVEKDFANIDLNDFDNAIEKRLSVKVDRFADYLKLDGYSLTPYQMTLLKEDCFKESEPFRGELRRIVTDFQERERIKREREEKMRVVQEKAELSKELFGAEKIDEDEIKDIKKYKTIDEQIDELMQQYSSWEDEGKFKKKK